ncbi:MAG: C1 family peptidase [bacterium]
MKKSECGVIKSPKDNRDWKAENILSKKIVLPERLMYKDDFKKPRAQHGHGTCSAMTASAVKEWQEYKDVFNIKKPYFSPAFVYNHRSNYPNEGMYSRNTMKILQKNGICLEEDYPYNDENVKNHKDEIPDEIISKAKNYRIKNYASVNSIDGLKKALKKNGPCYISFPVYNSTTRFWKKNENDEFRGGHAVTIVGYDDNKEIYDQKGAFLFRNSWGDDWGDNKDGHAWFPYCDFGDQWYIWTTIDEISKLPDKNYYINWAKNYFIKKIKKFFTKNKIVLITIASLLFLYIVYNLLS